MSNGIVIDLFMELFDVCRNACIPAAKFDEALKSLNENKSITEVPTEKYPQFQDDISTAGFTFIHFKFT